MMILFTYFFTIILKINFTTRLSNFDKPITKERSAQHNILTLEISFKIMFRYLQADFANYRIFMVINVVNAVLCY